MTPVEQLAERIAARRDLPPPAVRRALREASGVSRADVAEAVGCTAAAVGHWETGRRQPRPVHLPAYVTVLKLLAGGDA